METVIGKIVEKMMEFSCNQIGRHMDYWVGYKKYIKRLEDEAKILEDMRLSIQGKVDIARNNGDVIEDGVGEWVEEVGRKLGAVRQILEAQRQQLSCLSVGPSHRLGRRAEQEKEELSGLKARGDRLYSGPVSHPAPITCPLDTDPTKYERFESRGRVYESIMEALRDEADGSCYKIGISGLPGVGKTRIAFEVAKQALDAKVFDEVAKATVSQNPDFDQIRQDLADCLNLRWNTEGRLGRAGQLGSRLKNGNRILLLLDDVWDEINLMDIGIPDNIKGCKVLLTSRQGGLWDQMGISKVFEIKGLEDGEAWELFRKKVGDRVDQPGIRGVAEEVCRECGGLPLVILVVGGALMYKDEHMWNDTLRLLKNFKGDDVDGMAAKVYKPIELSYKYLNPDPQPSNPCDPTEAQSCFLHCCLFAEDAEISIDDLVRYGLGTRFLRNVDTVKEARDRVRHLVHKLKTSSLLLQGRHKNFVKMHDVIRDVAISVASKLKQNAFLVKTGVHCWQEIDKYDCFRTISVAISEPPDKLTTAIGELPDKLKCPNLGTLVLTHVLVRYPNPLLKVPNNFFIETEKLKVLDLTKFHIWTLPSALQNLVNLRMLSLTYCHFVSLSLSLFSELHKLEILCLNNCSMERPPISTNSGSSGCDIVEPAVEVRQLFRLQILDFSNTKGLRILPTGFISNLSRLEELYIYEFDGWEVEGNASPLELKSLAFLSTLEIHLPDVMLLPKGIHFESLIRFKISIGSRIDYWNNDSISRVLKIEGIPLKGELNALIERAQALLFLEINGLEKLLHDKDFPELEYLEVEQCNDMEHLLGKAKQDSQTSSASLGKLSKLIVSNCTVKYLFSISTAKRLQQLQELYVRDCERMEGIIGDRDDEEAMDGIVFNRLQKLNLRDLPKLKSICANMKQASSTECNTSTSTTQPLFNAKVWFPSLERLRVEGLDMMTDVWEKELLPIETGASHDDHQLCSFKKLSELTISWSCKLKYLFSPSMVKYLGQLQKLEVKNCKSMKAVIGDDKEEVMENIIFYELKRLVLEGLSNLKSMYGKLSSTECNASTSSTTSFNAKVSIPTLKFLSIDRCDSITRFGVVISNQEIQELTITSCEKIEELIATESEPKGREVIDDEILVFSQLQEIKLEKLPNLRKLSFSCASDHKEKKVSFPALTSLSIDGINSIARLELLISFQKLQSLTLTSCEKLQEIVVVEIGQRGKEALDDDILEFTQLKKVTLENLPNLKRCLTCGLMRQEKGKNDTTHLQALFNDKVLFSVLKKLNINGLKCIMAVSQLHLVNNEARDSFPQLKRLCVTNCENMEMIVAVEVEAGGEANENDMVLFPQLKDIRLQDLPNLKKFWGSCMSINQETMEDALFKFHHKVKAPHFVEVLHIKGVDKLKEIWDHTVEIDSVSKLKKLTVRDCGKLVNVGPLKLVESFANKLQELEIMKCPSLQDGFKIEASKGKYSFPMLETVEVIDGGMFEEILEGRVPLAEGSFLDKVRVVRLKECRQLVNVPWVLLLQTFEAVEELYITSCSSLKVVFSLKGVVLPDDDATERLATASSHVKELILRDLPKLEHIWMLMDYHPKGGLLVFSNLISLSVERCNSLTYLFSVSTARALPQLTYLGIESCDVMEEIVIIKNEEHGEENMVDDEIVFPRLQWVELRYLPKLRCFCGANNAFHFPFLSHVWIVECLELYTFTCGAIGMPPTVWIYFETSDNFMGVRDINSHVRRCAQRMRVSRVSGTIQ